MQLDSQMRKLKIDQREMESQKKKQKEEIEKMREDEMNKIKN